MGNTLYFVAILLILLWAIGYLGLHFDGIIHLLHVVAVIAVILRIIKGKPIE